MKMKAKILKGANNMCIALFGGMDRLERHYMDEAAKFGVDLRVFTRSEARISSKIRNVDAMVIFTNKVSHQVKKQAVNMAKAHHIPVFMHHSCGICTLRECLGCLNIIQGGVRNA
jgi:hypothetical protein